jgi:peptidylprolyl isomerase
MTKKEIIILILVAVLIVGGIVVYAQRTVEPKNRAIEIDTTASLEVEKVPASSDTTTNNNNQKTMEPETITTATGLKIQTFAQGTGEGAKAGDTVVVNYTGMLENGTVFDSNVDPKFNHVEPFAFPLGAGRVIAGWDQGVLGMKVGEKRRLTIPANLGYGATGAGALIPPNATLIFDVEVTDILK